MIINQYPIEKSPLYNLHNKRRLASLLGTDLKTLKGFLKTNNYKVFFNKHKRRIEEPIPALKNIHAKLKDLIYRIITPDWLKSGKRGVSIVDNAKMHINNPYVICVDIESFYKSVAKNRVFQTFFMNFKMSEDVAWLLTEIAMFTEKHNDNVVCFVPTGSPCSQLIAFWAYKQTFEDIATYCKSLGIIMSLYVDDITFSSDRRIASFLQNVNSRLKAVDLKLKISKIKKFGANKGKIITGCYLSVYQELKVKNKLRKSIKDVMGKTPIKSLSYKDTKTLFGKLNATRTIEKNIFDNIYQQVGNQLITMRKNK